MTTENEETTSTNRTATCLAYLGLLPFIIVLLILLLSNNDNLHDQLRFGIISYASLILCFVGAIHWGILLHTNNEYANWLYIVSILPMLLALICLLIPYQYAFGILFFSFLALFHYERRYLWPYFPEWFQLIRSRMSFSVSGILLIIWIISLN